MEVCGFCFKIGIVGRIGDDWFFFGLQVIRDFNICVGAFHLV